MTLDEIRKLVAEERAVVEKATPGPLMTIAGPPAAIWQRGVAQMHMSAACTVYALRPSGARTEAVVLANCGTDDAEAFARSRTAVPALCDAADALLAVVEALPKCWTPNCGSAATAERGIGEHRCERHRRPYDKDLPYAAALRALARKP